MPVRVVADRLSRSAPRQPVAAADLDRLARQRNDAVHQVGVHLGPHPGMHATHRAADHEPQMADPKPLGDETIAAVDHVTVAVMRKWPRRPSDGLLDPPRPIASGMIRT